jgi:hypothetical protein
VYAVFLLVLFVLLFHVFVLLFHGGPGRLLLGLRWLCWWGFLLLRRSSRSLFGNRGRRILLFNRGDLFLLIFTLLCRFRFLFGEVVVVAVAQHGHGFLDKVVNVVVVPSMVIFFAVLLFLFLFIMLQGLQAVTPASSGLR